MLHVLNLILWGELGVLILFLATVYRRWRNQNIQQPELKYVMVEHGIYCIVCAIVIVMVNDSGAAKDLFGLKPGNLTEVYCFSSVGLSIASITKYILGAAL